MMKKINKLLIYIFISVLIISVAASGMLLGRRAKASTTEFITDIEGQTEIVPGAAPSVKVIPQAAGGNVEFEFTQLISAEYANGVTPIIDFDLGVENFESKNIFGIRIDLTDSLDETQVISLGITGRDDNPPNAGVTVGLEKGELASYRIFHLPNSSRSYYGCFYDGPYVTNGTHFGGYVNGDTSNLSGPSRFALLYNNEQGNREVRVKATYAAETNIAEQNYLIADIDSEGYRTAYFGSADEQAGELFTSGYIRLSVKVYGADASASALTIYSIAGQPFDENGFTDCGPKIYVDAETNAIINKSYNLPVPYKIYDEMDAAELSDYNVNITDPSGSPVTHINGRFVPAQPGEYSIEYSAADSNDTIGYKTLKIRCFSSVPAVSFEGGGQLKDSYVLGEAITVPVYTATSDLSRAPDKKLKVLTVIQSGNEVIGSFEAEGEFQFKPAKTGTYSVYYIADSLGLGNYTRGAVFEVVDAPYISVGNNSSIALKDDYYILDGAYATYNGGKYPVVPKVTSPSGQSVEIGDTQRFLCSELGYYKVEYEFEQDGATAEKSFNICCVNSIEDMFVADRTDSIIPGAVIPEYARQSGMHGMLVTTSSANSSVEFVNKIDLKSLNKNVNLLSLVPYADGGEFGMFYMQVELTDVNDPSNRVVITVNPHAEGLAQYAYVNVNYDGRTLARSTELNGGIMTSGYHGCLIESSFGTGYGRADVPPFEIQFEPGENAFYVQTYYGSFGQWQLLDLDDPAQVGAGREWEGFSTGEVYVRFIFSQLNADKAGIILTGLAGYDLGEAYVPDTAAPALSITYPENITLEGGVLPEAKVNAGYPLPFASAYDTICGEIATDYELFYRDEPGTDLYAGVENNTFIPQKSGAYVYVISATDYFGNTVRQEYRFNASDKDFSLNVGFGTYENAYAGRWYTLPEITISGGSGTVSRAVNVTLNGKEISVNANNEIYLSETGKLRIEVLATDYIGSETSGANYLEIDVTAYIKPVITVTGVPEFVISGQYLKLGDFNVTDYNYEPGEEGYTPGRAIMVDGVTVYSVIGDNVTGSFNVMINKAAGETVEVRFAALDGEGNVTEEYIKYINVIKTPEYVSDFLIAESDNSQEGISIERGSMGSIYTFNGNLTVKTINPVATERMILRFSAVAGGVKIILRDFYNDSNVITFEIQESGGSCQIVWNGMAYPIAGSLEDLSRGFYIIFNADGSVYDGSGNSLCVITENDRGEEFTGFTKKGAVAEFELTSGGEGQFAILQIGNQMFTANNSEEGYSDVSAPEIVLNGEVESLQIGIGETVNVPAAYAYDVLCGITGVTVRVTDPSGATVSGFDNAALGEEKTFAADKYGYYVITYTAADENNRVSTSSYYIYVKDTVAPEITISGEVQTDIKAGQKVTFPPATATDNYQDPSLYLLVNLPDGSVVMLSEDRSYTFTEAGTYKLSYYAYDSDYNIAVREFVLTVK